MWNFNISDFLAFNHYTFKALIINLALFFIDKANVDSLRSINFVREVSETLLDLDFLNLILGL